MRWLGLKAEELGVEIYPGFAASEVLIGWGSSMLCSLVYTLTLSIYSSDPI